MGCGFIFFFWEYKISYIINNWLFQRLVQNKQRIQFNTVISQCTQNVQCKISSGVNEISVTFSNTDNTLSGNVMSDDTYLNETNVAFILLHRMQFPLEGLKERLH